MKRLATEQAIGLACFLLCGSLVYSETLPLLGRPSEPLSAIKELYLHGLTGKIAVLSSKKLQIQGLSTLDLKRSDCVWLAQLTSAAAADTNRDQHQKDEVALQQSLLSNRQEVWQLPGDLTWRNVSRVLLRCEHGKEPRAWAFVPPAQEHQKAAAKNLQQHDGQLSRWLRWLQNPVHSIMGWWSLGAPFRRVDGQGKGSEGRGDLEGWDGQDRQRAERFLQQAELSADRQLSVYPGQTSNGPTGSPRAGTGQGAGQPGGQSQAGMPRPLFPTFSGSTPSATPTPQQLLQVGNNGDKSQQTSPSTPLQTVDPAIAFSALDVGSSPAAITTPSVTIVNNSPSTPMLGGYPDSLLNTPAAFPGESPSPPSAGATGTIASPPPSAAAATAVPIDTSQGADFGEASTASPPVQAQVAQPPAQTQTPAPTPTPTQPPVPTQTPALLAYPTPVAMPFQAPAPAPAQATPQPAAASTLPVAVPIQAPVQTPVQTPQQTLAAAVPMPARTPVQVPVQAPAQLTQHIPAAIAPPAVAPSVVPNKAPAQAAPQTPAAAPVAVPAQAPAKAPAQAPQQTPAAAVTPPVQAPAQAPVQAPQAAALSTRGSVSAVAPVQAPTQAAASIPAAAPATPPHAAQAPASPPAQALAPVAAPAQPTQLSAAAATPEQAPAAAAIVQTPQIGASLPPAQAPQASTTAAPVIAPAAAPVPQSRSAAPVQAPEVAVQPPVQAQPAGAAVTAVPPVQGAPALAPQVAAPVAPVQAPQPAVPAIVIPVTQLTPAPEMAPAPSPFLAPTPAPQQHQLPAGVTIPVTPVKGSPIAAPAPAPVALANPPALEAGIAASPLQATPAPAPEASFGAAPGPDISALLLALSPADRMVVASQNLSSLAGAAGQNLSSVGGQDLSGYSNATAGALLGNIIATGNALAPVPASDALPLQQAVATAGVPTPGASSAARHRAGGAVRRTPQPVLDESDDLAPALGPDSSQAPAAGLTGGEDVSSAEAAALQAAGAPAQSADAALIAAAIAGAVASQDFGAAAPAPAAAIVPSQVLARAPARAPAQAPARFPSKAPARAPARAPAKAPGKAPAMAPEVAPAPAPLAADDTDLSSAVSAAAAQAPSLPDDSAQLASQVADSKAPAPAPAEEAAAPTLAPAPAPGSASGLTAFGGAQDPSKAQAPASQSNYASDSDLAEAAIAASLAPAPTPPPAAAPAPAPDRGKRVSSASLPSAPAPAPVVSEAPPPEGNVTLSYQPPSDLSAGAYPTGTPPAAAAPVEAAAPSPVSTVPAPAPAPVQAAAPAPAQSAQVAAAAPTPLQALAPGPGEVASAAPAPAPVTSMASAPAPTLAPVPTPAQPPVQAPAPGPSNERVINLSLNLAGAGLSNLSMENSVAIREALADRLHLYPSQIQIVGNSTTGGPPQAAARPPQTRHLLQGGSSGEGANLQIQIRPTPDQRSSVMNTLQQPDFNNSLKNSLAAQGLQVSSANVASVSESGGPSPPVAPAPSPAGKWKGQDATLKKIHGWFMFAAFIILLPAGILTANLFSRTHARHPWWFYAHATLTGLGSISAICGLGIGLVLIVPNYYAMIHRWIGISIIVAIVIQLVLSFLLRPAPEHFLRRSWNLVHWWWGRLTVIAALGNFFYGLWMVGSGLIWYIVPAAIVAAFLIAAALKAVIDYLREPSGGAMPARGKVQDFQNPMRKDFHILGGATTSQRKGGMLDLYGGPKPGVGGLRSRPSYLGGGDVQLAQLPMQSPAGSGPLPAQNGGGSFTASRRRTSMSMRGDSPPVSGDPMPQSAFYNQAQEIGNRKDSKSESLESLDEGQQDEGESSESRAGPRQPLHPLSSRASFADRLPPRPSELLKEGKLGAGEAIMARRRQRRLVPDGALSSRPSIHLATRPSALGYMDEGNPMAKRSDNFRPRPRPSRVAGSPSQTAGSPTRARERPGGMPSPEEVFGSRTPSPGKMPAQSNDMAHNNSPPSDNSVDENDAPPLVTQLPPHVQGRIASFGR